MNSYFIGTISLIALFILFFFIEKITALRKDKEITRKLGHVIAGLFAIAMASILERDAFVVLSGISIFIMFFAYRVRLFKFIHDVNRTTIGEILLPAGVFSTYLIANPASVFYSSILILTISDTLGGLTAYYFKKINYLSSIVFFFSSFFILSIFYGLGAQFILIALLITAVERISNYGTDNLTVPFIAAFSLTLLLQ